MGPEFLTNLLLEYKYLILAPSAFILGPTVSLIAGVLLRLDVLALVPTCIALAAGELGGDVLWYTLGRRYGDRFVDRFGRYVGITEASVANVRQLFNNHHDLILFTSKLTAGLGVAPVVLFSAGMSRVPFRRYMMLNIAGQFLWTAGLLSIGYFLGHIYFKVGDALEAITLTALGTLILVSLIGFGRYMRGSITNESPRPQ